MQCRWTEQDMNWPIKRPRCDGCGHGIEGACRENVLLFFVFSSIFFYPPTVFGQWETNPNFGIRWKNFGRWNSSIFADVKELTFQHHRYSFEKYVFKNICERKRFGSKDIISFFSRQAKRESKKKNKWMTSLSPANGLIFVFFISPFTLYFLTSYGAFTPPLIASALHPWDVKFFEKTSNCVEVMTL